MHTAFDEGQNTFQDPLSYDFVAATGGVVSYGYFTLPQPGESPDVKVNVPLITSGTTAFLAAYKNCLLDSADDELDRHRTFVFERIFAVGDGDVASITDKMYRLRGSPTGELSGHVLWRQTGQPVPNAQVMVLHDSESDPSLGGGRGAGGGHLATRGDFGVLNAIDADQGSIASRMVTSARRYLPVPTPSWPRPTTAALWAPLQVTIQAGRDDWSCPRCPRRPSSSTASPTSGPDLPAKIALVRLDDEGRPLEARRAASALSRARSVRATAGSFEINTASGHGEVQVLPGRYDVIVSRGYEYSLHREYGLELRSGGVAKVEALIDREIDTSGWMSIDTHLHAIPSFDSGMPLDERVKAAAAEGLDFAVATDHDVRTDYRPIIRELLLEPHLASVIGEETTTLEMGHFIGFPLAFEQTAIPGHGAIDWTCMPLGELFAETRAAGDGMDPLTIVAHPRDGFLGYMSQLGVDTYTMNRALTMFEQNNPVFRTASCDFDAMEVLNAKRFELLRTPSVAEVVDFNRCLRRLNAATNIQRAHRRMPRAGQPASAGGAVQ